MSEFKQSLVMVLVNAVLTVVPHYWIYQGRSRIYRNIGDYGWPYFIFSIFAFLIFSDFLIYWIHRILHWPFFYKHIHKAHHNWLNPDPYSAFAFHPADGFIQSSPYWIFIFLFPLHHILHAVLYCFVLFWAVSIHDRIVVKKWTILNSANHHFIHHRDFNYNYGQYFTLFDRIFGTYKDPITGEKNKKK